MRCTSYSILILSLLLSSSNLYTFFISLERIVTNLLKFYDDLTLMWLIRKPKKNEEKKIKKKTNIYAISQLGKWQLQIQTHVDAIPPCGCLPKMAGKLAITTPKLKRPEVIHSALDPQKLLVIKIHPLYEWDFSK